MCSHYRIQSKYRLKCWQQLSFIHSFISLLSVYPYICKTMDVETVKLIINVFVIKQMSKTKYRYITWIT